MSTAFSILVPVTSSPRSFRVFQLGEDWTWVIRERRSKSEPMALDFETRGDWGDPTGFPVGVALSDSRGSVYIPFEVPTESAPVSPTYSRLMHLLKEEQVPLLAHNVPFDGGWVWRDFGFHLNWLACTYAGYMLCATEGWDGQKWGLKDAMVDCLGWAETNEAGIDNWLVDHGYFTSSSKEPKEGWVLRGEGEERRWLRPDKGEMWRVPHSILGPYACADADACWQLWTQVLEPCIRRFAVLQDYVLNWYPPYMKLLIEQKQRGILIDVSALTKLEGELRDEVQVAYRALQSLPEVEPHIRFVNDEAVAEVARAEPPRTLKAKPLGREPARFTKAGAESETWKRWRAKADLREAAERQPELVPPSKRWLQWRKRLDEVRTAAAEGKLFNWGSGPQRAWLFYERMGFPILMRTDSGLPSTDEDALQGLGPVGKALIEIQAKEKVRQFCEQTLALIRKDSCTIHPSFRVPGTLTGRLSGKSPNVQQAPGNKAYLNCWVARPGFKIVACDVVSLENYVLAEMSRDPSLWKLYGPDARPGQDAYLFNAAQLPIIGPKIQATGYDPDTATAEDTAKAKRGCKPERAIGKVFTLASNYGAGARKIQVTLKVQAGIDLPLAQVEEMHGAFWDLYAGIQEYARKLERLWEKNGGAVLNGIGRPVGVAEAYKKDLVNRVIQSTGHDLLVKKVLISDQLLTEAGIEHYPWILDLHDAEYWEVREDQAERAKELVEKAAYAKLNEWMQGAIKLKGEATLTQTWGETKSE